MNNGLRNYSVKECVRQAGTLLSQEKTAYIWGRALAKEGKA
jgi:hypothetical protein